MTVQNYEISFRKTRLKRTRLPGYSQAIRSVSNEGLAISNMGIVLNVVHPCTVEWLQRACMIEHQIVERRRFACYAQDILSCLPPSYGWAT
jgi:hypothetical protein